MVGVKVKDLGKILDSKINLHPEILRLTTK